MGETESLLEVPVGAKTLRAVIVFNSIKIKGQGMYNFSISLREKEKECYREVASIPLEVEILKSTV